MGKFGGFSAGSISGAFGGALKGTNLGTKVDKIVSDLENGMTNITPEKMENIMSKATVGNLASFVGGKAGLDVDASKIDGVVGKFYELKANIRSTIVDSILGVAEKAGYKITLPNEETIIKFLETSGLMPKLESFGDEISDMQIEELIKGIDIKQTASNLGLLVEKVPSKFDSLADGDKTLGEIASGVGSALADVAEPLGTGLKTAASETISSLNDIKNIATNNEGE